MSDRNLILPGNPRYQPKVLQGVFGYDNLYKPLARVEIATMQVLGEIGVIPADDIALLTPDVVEQLIGITTTQVDEVERITRHDVRAWVRLAQEILPPSLRRWVHVPLTSYDPLDTGRALQFAEAHQRVIQPHTRRVIVEFRDRVRELAHQVQIGRTHGQHALPITVGFWLANILYRVIYNARMVDASAGALCGKLSGAVGAYNAQVGLGIDELCRERIGGQSFEERVLKRVGLPAAPISTQILPPEQIAYHLHACVMLSGVFGQFGVDCRHLMRSEIAEISEPFADTQVGSSTMPQKRNPATFENLEGAWKKNRQEYGKVFELMTSEHQRDLVGSSVMRDLPIIVVNLVHQLTTLLRTDKTEKSFVARLSVNPEMCRRNLAMSGDSILAEPLYLALQMAGFEGDAHEVVSRKAIPLARAEELSLLEAVEQLAGQDEALGEAFAAIPAETRGLLERPERYTGDAEVRAHEIADLADEYLQGL